MFSQIGPVRPPHFGHVTFRRLIQQVCLADEGSGCGSHAVGRRLSIPIREQGQWLPGVPGKDVTSWPTEQKRVKQGVSTSVGWLLGEESWTGRQTSGRHLILEMHCGWPQDVSRSILV